ncbi:MAG: insulinase family protein [Acidobacteria bacterium]|nr:insulinase family protein [Acidobacteriota bacterium]
MSLTIAVSDPAYPFKDTVEKDVRAVLAKLGSDKEVAIQWGAPPPAPRGGTPQGRADIPGVKSIVAVASGKGGVGKSALAAELAERDIPQSIVLFGHAGLKRDDVDFYAASVMNYILGGSGFTARLTDEIRVKRGLAYGVYSYLLPMDHAALFMGRVATENGAVAETLDILRAEFARMRDEGVGEQELIDAKTYLTGSFPLRLDSNGKIARLLVGIQLEDLGIDYIDRRNDYIEAVTLEDIRRIARRLLHPEDLEVVVVGKPANLEATN